jgi:hypothetical protein
MNVTNKPNTESVEVDTTHAPRKLTLAENLILTVKVLVGFGLLGAALWAVKAWTSGS